VRVVGEDEGSPAEASVKLVVLFVETRSGDELGEIEVNGRAKGDSVKDDGRHESVRRAALHQAADEIASYLEDKRGRGDAPPRAEPSHVASPKAAPSASPGEDPFAESDPNVQHKVCLSRCDAPASSSLGQTELERTALAVDKTLLSLRACLDRVGGTRIEPAIILRFRGEGGGAQRLVGMRVDMGGYEDLVCVDGVRARLPNVPPLPARPSAAPTGRERDSMVRCVHHCS
jgi:hypothetical protein